MRTLKSSYDSRSPAWQPTNDDGCITPELIARAIVHLALPVLTSSLYWSQISGVQNWAQSAVCSAARAASSLAAGYSFFASCGSTTRSKFGSTPSAPGSRPNSLSSAIPRRSRLWLWAAVGGRLPAERSAHDNVWLLRLK